MLGERPPRSVDEAVAIGERLSALMMAEYLETTGVRARAVNAADVIVTDARVRQCDAESWRRPAKRRAKSSSRC